TRFPGVLGALKSRVRRACAETAPASNSSSANETVRTVVDERAARSVPAMGRCIRNHLSVASDAAPDARATAIATGQLRPTTGLWFERPAGLADGLAVIE